MSLKLLLFYLLIVFIPNAFANKIKILQNEIKSQCGEKPLSRQKIISLARKAFLSCRPEEKIEIESSCFIKCLRENVGNIIARRGKF
ncbi:MAG: hypothetical protein OXB84_04915 [Halobacteriovoraceae bacterium]|nr:hypothetical protein [Halobacteriovoraceae bacterium]